MTAVRRLAFAASAAACGGASPDVHAIGNRFGRNSYFDCPILKSTKTTLDSPGNVWDDDGTTVPIQTHD